MNRQRCAALTQLNLHRTLAAYTSPYQDNWIVTTPNISKNNQAKKNRANILWPKSKSTRIHRYVLCIGTVCAVRCFALRTFLSHTEVRTKSIQCTERAASSLDRETRWFRMCVSAWCEEKRATQTDAMIHSVAIEREWQRQPPRIRACQCENGPIHMQAKMARFACVMCVF